MGAEARPLEAEVEAQDQRDRVEHDRIVVDPEIVVRPVYEGEAIARAHIGTGPERDARARRRRQGEFPRRVLDGRRADADADEGLNHRPRLLR
jgi:hypothetical protein